MIVSREAAHWLALLSANQVKRPLAKRVIHRWCVLGQQPLAALFDLGAAEAADRLALSHAEATQVLATGPDVAGQQAALDRLSTRGIGVITRVDAAYPDLLAERLPEERLPYYLFYYGERENLTQPGVAILGASEPTREAQALIQGLVAALADAGHLLVGGYDRGADRLALDSGRDAGAAITWVLPAGMEAIATGQAGGLSPAASWATGAVLQRLAPRGRADRVLALSPFAPATPYSDALAASRLCLIGALAEVLVLVAPDKGPDELPDLRDLSTLADEPGLRRVLAWTGDRGAATRAWVEAGAQPFDGVEAGLAHVQTRFGAATSDVPRGAGVDDLPGVEPITFRDADSAIEALKQTGRVPDVLALRLREAEWDQEWNDE